MIMKRTVFHSQKSRLVLEQNLCGQPESLKTLTLATGSRKEGGLIAPVDYVIHLRKLLGFLA